MIDLQSTVQDATIAALEQLSDKARKIVVEAWDSPEPTTELCSEDSLHGPGLVQVPLNDGQDTICHSLCLACAVTAVESMIQDGRTWISLEVTA